MADLVSVKDYNQWSKSYRIQQDNGDGVPSKGDIFVDRTSGKEVAFEDVQSDICSYYVERGHELSDIKQFEAKGRESSRAKQLGQQGKDTTQMLAKLRKEGADIKVEEDSYVITGKDLSLPNRAVLQEGSIRFKEGRWFINAGERVVINGLEIKGLPDYNKMPTTIFFDGKDHQGDKSYVSFDVKNSRLVGYSEDQYDGPEVALLRTNPFVPLDLNDSVSIIPRRGGAFLLEGRQRQNKIPLITVAQSPNCYTTVYNGEQQIGIVGGGRINVSASLGSGKRSGAPFEIIMNDDDGTLKELQIYVRSGILNFNDKPVVSKRLILSNYDEAGTLRIGEESRLDGLPGFAQHITTTELSPANTTTYTMADFKKKFPHLKYTGYSDSSRIKLVIGYLESLPPKILAALKGVDFPSPDKWAFSKAGAYASPDGIIHLRKEDLHLPVFQHETAHILTFHLQQLAVGHIKDSFEYRWRQIAGDHYLEYLDPEHLERINQHTWKGFPNSDQSPRYGYAYPYGNVNFHEDVSTFVEKIWANPSVFKPFVTKGSDKYDKRYPEKMALLLEYGYITQEQYDHIIGADAKQELTAESAQKLATESVTPVMHLLTKNGPLWRYNDGDNSAGYQISAGLDFKINFPIDESNGFAVGLMPEFAVAFTFLNQEDEDSWLTLMPNAKLSLEYYENSEPGKSEPYRIKVAGGYAGRVMPVIEGDEYSHGWTASTDLLFSLGKYYRESSFSSNAFWGPSISVFHFPAEKDFFLTTGVEYQW